MVIKHDKDKTIATFANICIWHIIWAIKTNYKGTLPVVVGQREYLSISCKEKAIFFDIFKSPKSYGIIYL
jgi:hypothetical protein